MTNHEAVQWLTERAPELHFRGFQPKLSASRFGVFVTLADKRHGFHTECGRAPGFNDEMCLDVWLSSILERIKRFESDGRR